MTLERALAETLLVQKTTRGSEWMSLTGGLQLIRRRYGRASGTPPLRLVFKDAIAKVFEVPLGIAVLEKVALRECPRARSPRESQHGIDDASREEM